MRPVQAQAIELTCATCDPYATCAVCNLYRFVKALEYHSGGMEIDAAAERANVDSWEAVRTANRRHDEGRKARIKEPSISEAEQTDHA